MSLDGSMGEGGGQVLRTALALSLVTGEPFRIKNIRASRPKPGLAAQHLVAVRAAAEISGAEVLGAERGSRELTFFPRKVRAGTYRWAVGTAGSVGLVLQAVLPALLLAAGDSQLQLEGGTHNPQAPPFEFLAEALFPALRTMGASVEAQLVRPGFYPAGGGQLEVRVRGGRGLSQLVLLERGEVKQRWARAWLSRLPRHVGERELSVVKKRLGFREEECQLLQAEAAGPGNALILGVKGPDFSQVVSAFGQRGIPAEEVALEVVNELQRFLAAQVPVGVHLADQLLVPMAIAQGGTFRTLPLSLHARTVLQLLPFFVPVEVLVSALPGGREEVEILPQRAA